MTGRIGGLEGIWRHLGGVWEAFGDIWEAFWRHLGGIGRLLGGIWRHLGPPGITPGGEHRGVEGEMSLQGGYTRPKSTRSAITSLADWYTLTSNWTGYQTGRLATGDWIGTRTGNQ